MITHYFIFLILVVILILAFILVCLKIYKNKKGNELDNILNRLKQDEVRDFVIADGVDAFLEVERLILTEHGLLLIETHAMNGHLFGAEHLDQWTQITEGRSFKFTNPLHHIQNTTYALQQLLPKVPISYKVVFTGNSDFPKGKPEHVSTLQSLEEDLQLIRGATKRVDNIPKAWERILKISQKNEQQALRGTSL